MTIPTEIVHNREYLINAQLRCNAREGEEDETRASKRYNYELRMELQGEEGCTHNAKRETRNRGTQVYRLIDGLKWEGMARSNKTPLLNGTSIQRWPHLRHQYGLNYHGDSIFYKLVMTA